MINYLCLLGLLPFLLLLLVLLSYEKLGWSSLRVKGGLLQNVSPSWVPIIDV